MPIKRKNKIPYFKMNNPIHQAITQLNNLVYSVEPNEILLDNGKESTLIAIFAEDANPDGIRAILRRNANVHLPVENPPLKRAILAGSPECVRILIQNGATPKPEYLYLATRVLPPEHCWKIIRRLLESGSPWGYVNPLCELIRNANLKDRYILNAIHDLVIAGCSLSRRNPSKHSRVIQRGSPIHLALNFPHVLEALLYPRPKIYILPFRLQQNNELPSCIILG